MTRIVDHYSVLGVTPTATRDEIRIAYRALARQNHPDTKGDTSQQRMAQINEAWRVLADPARRAVYDFSRRSSATPSPSGSSPRPPTAESRSGVSARPPATVAVTPARFPWRFMLVLAALGIAFVLVNAALTKPPRPLPPDNVLGPGSCVVIEPNGDAREVTCAGSNDGVVDELLALDGICAAGTVGHRDRQGMGLACIRLATPG